MQARPVRSRVRVFGTRRRVGLWCGIACLGLWGAVGGEPVGAEEVPTTTEVPVPDGEVALPRSGGVRLRVGPRVDNAPVARLEADTVLLVIDAVYEWAMVRVPSGFRVACASRFLEAVDEDHVRVTATKLNLRVHPPDPARPTPAAFRDAATQGQVLVKIAEEGEWTWVEAPPGTRAFVRADLLRILGPAHEHADRIAAARDARATRLRQRQDERVRRQVEAQGALLAEALGTTQRALHRARLQGGTDRTPIVRLETALKDVVAQTGLAPAPARRIARSLLEDLEAELRWRLAHHDAALARLRQENPKAPAPLTATRDRMTVRGVIRWEAAPRWRDGGAWILWQGEVPRYVLRLTTGTEGPLPDLAKLADGTPRTLTARQPGTRAFGLPDLDVLEVQAED